MHIANLMIAESDPGDKDVIVMLVVDLINRYNGFIYVLMSLIIK